MNFLDDAEPFRIKMVEPIRKTTREEREKLVKAADRELFDKIGYSTKTISTFSSFL